MTQKHVQRKLRNSIATNHDDVIKWKHFPRYWPFVRGIHRSPVSSPHKGLWRGALILSLICVWINSWVNNREAGGLRRYRAHYDVSVMYIYRVPFTMRMAMIYFSMCSTSMSAKLLLRFLEFKCSLYSSASYENLIISLLCFPAYWYHITMTP